MSLYSSGLKWLQSIDPDDVIQSGISFTAAHTGCIAAPLLSTATAGVVPANAGLTTAVLFSMGSVLGVDAIIQKIKMDDCARCVAARVDPFRRYGKMLVMAGLIGVGMHFVSDHSAHASDHHVIQQTPDGRMFMLNSETLCGPDGKTIAPADTLWLNP